MSESKKKILVVDDDRDLVRAVKAYLEARGLEVDAAHNGTDAQALMAERKPDLVVLDIMMDYDTEGFNLAYKLKTEKHTQDIPIIILSGFMQHLDKTPSFEFIQGREWPAAKFLEKPVNLGELASAIDGLFTEAAARQRKTC